MHNIAKAPDIKKYNPKKGSKENQEKRTFN
jgi:hypothetical protein